MEINLKLKYILNNPTVPLEEVRIKVENNFICK